jgi:myo-inositol-1(or 4)-monophosphatase
MDIDFKIINKMDIDLIKCKDVMMEAVNESAKILLEYLDTDFKIGRKRDYSDLVTEVDKKSESKIIEVIHKYFPEHNVLSEEIGDLNMLSDYVWIVDPIDGTVNYAHSVPIFCISIALEIKKVVEMGVVYNPVSKEKFFAEKGKGAYLNDKKIHVSDAPALRDALLVTGFPYGASDNMDHCIDHFINFVKLSLPIRRLGSAALDICYTACGYFDGFWEVNLNAWDVAAGYLIAREAGAVITDFFGKDYSIYNRQILATNGKIHTEMMEVLAKAYE